IVLDAKRRNVTEKRDLAFVIATNLSCLTDEMLNFCREHAILISTSLDGPADLHNGNRPKPGNDSHEITIDGIRRAREALGVDQVSALMTTTKASLPRVTEIIDEYVMQGFKGIFLRNLSPYGFAIKTRYFDGYDSDGWLDFYQRGLDYILKLNKGGYGFAEFF